MMLCRELKYQPALGNLSVKEDSDLSMSQSYQKLIIIFENVQNKSEISSIDNSENIYRHILSCSVVEIFEFAFFAECRMHKN